MARPRTLTLSDAREVSDFVEKHTRQSSGCWEWTGHRNRLGYGTFLHHGRRYMAGRVVWTLVNGELPDGYFVCHHCDNPPCVNPAHLFAGPPKANTRDMLAKGRQARGSRAGPAKLSEIQVDEIRRLAALGVSSRQIAPRFVVTARTIRRIVSRERWGWRPAPDGHSPQRAA